MWNVLDRFAENVRVYSTPVGQLWNTVNFVFRLFVIVAVGSSVYGDEQGAFKCDTGQPGCQNVCFNRFSPISHMRFWAFQILFVSTPPIFFYLYAGMQTGKVKKLEAQKLKLTKNKEEMEEAAKLLMNEEAHDDDGGKSQAAFSTYLVNKEEVEKNEKKVLKLSKEVGRYKEKQVNEMAKGGQLTQVIFTTKVRVVYILHCIMKFGIEVLFLYLGYILQQQQSLKTGLDAWSVPEKYTCTHALIYGAAGSACAQQEKVTCWVSRPWEKQYFLYYMLTMTGLSMLLTFIEALYMMFRTTRRSIQRKASDDAEKRREKQGQFMGYDASNFPDNMMTMRSTRGIKSGLNAANSFRYKNANLTGGRGSLAPSYQQYMHDPRYQYAGAPFLEDCLPDNPLMRGPGPMHGGRKMPPGAGYYGQQGFNQSHQMQPPIHENHAMKHPDSLEEGDSEAKSASVSKENTPQK